MENNTERHVPAVPTIRQGIVLDAMVDVLREKSTCPTMAELSERTGLHRRKVQAALEQLEKKGLVSRPFRAVYRPLATSDGRRVTIDVTVCHP